MRSSEAAEYSISEWYVYDIVIPIKYAHSFRFIVICCSQVLVEFTHIPDDYFTDTRERSINEVILTNMII